MRKHSIILFFLISIFAAQPAHAYIDPGSGSAIMGAIIGFFVAVSITLKTYWYKILSLFGKGKPPSDDAE